MGTALLAGASVASVVIGLAAQSTLGNLVAGIAITIYRPFRLGDTLQVATPTGNDIGTVELISLGYTTLRAPAGHLIVLPNASAASQVIINLNSTFSAVADRDHHPLEQKCRSGGGSKAGGQRRHGACRGGVRDRLLSDQDGRSVDHLGIARCWHPTPPAATRCARN